jgi:glycerol uptake facilitator-like aquaporin
VTIGRAFSDTFAGIEPASVPMFIVAQLVGAGTATGLVLVIYPHIGDVADRVVVPH